MTTSRSTIIITPQNSRIHYNIGERKSESNRGEDE
jgi:hypothetical protein